ncbi:LeuA family protein [Leadbettera azotonutricia]|uniref:2-isopropylmalate synthase n=1 Tax=Leadbettera azotonutricia (strain ATCC BAA-888 / DSM 13862 / ZAS-9) TaxID=545695 RepID=F5Y995_LEAAZ|nr:2-isopropylmalate synthase [Leadbettera azotonutricia]AEF81138.1 2-isopropylmalate synthase (Alpha-isopropylmalatesynthase) (Alpha-IPM synthetase) [Leadbettera azotonutricia ZAS-9]
MRSDIQHSLSRVSILDTTLRDGDQAAGFAFSADAKLKIGRALAAVGVDIIETGFPLSSPADLEACRLLALDLSASGFRGLTAVMCRGRRFDIQESAKVFKGEVPGLLHISLPVSKIHIEAKLGKTEAEVLDMAREAVSYAAGLCAKVELGAEDASRADRNFLADYCAAAIEAGASIVNIADTLGSFCPKEIHDLVSFLLEKTPAFRDGKAVLSVHCHNDLGLACANTLEAIEAGCGQVEVSVSGIGERAGNAALEEIAANLAARPEHYQVSTNLLVEKIPPLVSMAAEISGTSGSLMKPLSGWNVRAHGSGIHQQGLSRSTETYSPQAAIGFTMVPERIVLSRHSGRAGVDLFCRRYCGFELDEETISRVTAHIKSSHFFEEGSAGISEFLCLLADIHKLPGTYEGPLIVDSWSEHTGADNEGNIRAQFEASLKIYGSNKTVQKISGSGDTAISAAFGALCKLGTLELKTVSLNGAGNRVRLYAEILADSRIYSAEHSGSEPSLLLFRCGLDALNAETLRS